MRTVEDIAREMHTNFAAFESSEIALEAFAERQAALLAEAHAVGKVDQVLTLIGDETPRSAAFRIAREDRDRWKAIIARGETPRATPEGLARLDMIRKAGLVVLVSKAGYTLADQERGVAAHDWFAR